MNTAQSEQPVLTGIASVPPTTRDIATQYKAAGIAGVPKIILCRVNTKQQTSNERGTPSELIDLNVLVSRVRPIPNRTQTI
jgi:hypothetical protein